MRSTLAFILALAGVAGCRHVPAAQDTGRSSFLFIDPPPAPPPRNQSTATAELTNQAQYRQAHVVGRPPLPVYPRRALVAKAGAATVAVHVTLDGNGQITDIRPSLLALSTPGPHAEDFRAAVEAALRQWKFEPARIEQIETVTEKGFTYNRVAKTETEEAEFDLSFTFTATGGTQLVPTGR